MKHKNGEQLLQHMELIDDELIEQAAQPPKKRSMLRVRALSLAAACMAFVAVVTVVAFVSRTGTFDSQAEEQETYLVLSRNPDDPPPTIAERIEPWYIRPQAPYVDHEVAATISRAMYAGDVIKLIGMPNRSLDFDPRDAWGGKYSFQWDLDDGTCLHVRFYDISDCGYIQGRVKDYELMVQKVAIYDHSPSSRHDEYTLLAYPPDSNIADWYTDLVSRRPVRRGEYYEAAWQKTDPKEPKSETETTTSP